MEQKWSFKCAVKAVLLSSTFADAAAAETHFCTSLLCRVCGTAIYFSGLFQLGKHNLVLIIKSLGHVPGWSEANSWYTCNVHINISTLQHHQFWRLQLRVQAGSKRNVCLNLNLNPQNRAHIKYFFFLGGFQSSVFFVLYRQMEEKKNGSDTWNMK